MDSKVNNILTFLFIINLLIIAPLLFHLITITFIYIDLAILILLLCTIVYTFGLYKFSKVPQHLFAYIIISFFCASIPSVTMILGLNYLIRGESIVETIPILIADENTPQGFVSYPMLTEHKDYKPFMYIIQLKDEEIIQMPVGVKISKARGCFGWYVKERVEGVYR